MATVRDPDFWKRFSRAVHQDEEAQEEQKRPGNKHSYVSPSARRYSLPSSSTSPISLSPLTSDMATIAMTPQPYSTFTTEHPKEPIISTTDYAPPEPTSPRPQLARKLTKSNPSPCIPAPTHAFTSHRNTSQLTLGFSGRPPSRFKFWTQITSDTGNRDSWLENQRKKKRQRTWICWVFWLSLAGLVTAVVVVGLFLKSRRII